MTPYEANCRIDTSLSVSSITFSSFFHPLVNLFIGSLYTSLNPSALTLLKSCLHLALLKQDVNKGLEESKQTGSRFSDVYFKKLWENLYTAVRRISWYRTSKCFFLQNEFSARADPAGQSRRELCKLVLAYFSPRTGTRFQHSVGSPYVLLIWFRPITLVLPFSKRTGSSTMIPRRSASAGRIVFVFGRGP